MVEPVVQNTAGYLLVMLTSALENCSSVTESGTEKETLDSEKWCQKVGKRWHSNNTMDSFLDGRIK